ncbi:uncharacterized protein RCO7_03940 [Rhynchosporium graminicola]|uniref:Amidase domain-containing protein n=1 Tax=Rhynchosporium graminicola TaxID=2792576 RepID=A0A1E1L5G9_9HELO|nr:uncharacterized protein RCO7_03940 [Rhynchosporium commune]
MSHFALSLNVNFLEATSEMWKLHLDNRNCTSVDLVTAYLKRIEKDNIHGAAIRAIIETDDRADIFALAQELVEERKGGKIRGPLHGIPIDNIAIRGKLKTTTGSKVLHASVVARDSTVVAKLRKAGLIIIGKAILSEWCNYRASGVLPNAWSGTGGLGLSPFNPGLDPSGSSSGSASAIAAGFIPLAIGSETDGSLICPSSRAGIWALKPTVGLISRAGIIPVSLNQDSPGPMAKNVKDIALLLNALVGPDEADPASIGASSGRRSDYTAFLTPNFEGLRVGVMNPEWFMSDQNIPYDAKYIIESTLSALKRMEDAGAVVKNPVNLPTLDEMLAFNPSDVQHLDFKEGLKSYLANLESSDIHTLEDVMQWNYEHLQKDFESQITFEEVLEWAKKDISAHDEALSRQLRLSRDNGIDVVLKTHDLDILLVPSDAKKATRISAMAGLLLLLLLPPLYSVPVSQFLRSWHNLRNQSPSGVHLLYEQCTNVSSASLGYPVANLPLGIQPNGLPFGLAIFAGRFREDLLLRAMSAFEALYPDTASPEAFKRDASWPPVVS